MLEAPFCLYAAWLLIEIRYAGHSRLFPHWCKGCCGHVCGGPGSGGRSCVSWGSCGRVMCTSLRSPCWSHGTELRVTARASHLGPLLRLGPNSTGQAPTCGQKKRQCHRCTQRGHYPSIHPSCIRAPSVVDHRITSVDDVRPNTRTSIMHPPCTRVQEASPTGSRVPHGRICHMPQ